MVFAFGPLKSWHLTNFQCLHFENKSNIFEYDDIYLHDFSWICHRNDSIKSVFNKYASFVLKINFIFTQNPIKMSLEEWLLKKFENDYVGWIYILDKTVCKNCCRTPNQFENIFLVTEHNHRHILWMVIWSMRFKHTDCDDGGGCFHKRIEVAFIGKPWS